MIYRAIDRLSDKSRELAPVEVAAICDRLRVPRDKPILLPVGRFDRFKDPLGVIEAYRLVERPNAPRVPVGGGGGSAGPRGGAPAGRGPRAEGRGPEPHRGRAPS